MSRPFSIVRRRANLVDLIAPPIAGVDGYRLKWAANFDAVAWTTFITAGLGGYTDPNVDYRKLHMLNGNHVRIVFDPATFHIADATPFWVQFFPVTGGVEGTGGPATLILPTNAFMGFASYVVAGSAPVGADFAHALQLDLPRGARQTIRVQNEADMFMAFDAGGPEMFLNASPAPKYLDVWIPQGSIWVRGVGAAVPFSALFTQNATL